MSGSGSPPSKDDPRMQSLCEAYRLGITIRNELKKADLVTTFEKFGHSIDAIEDGYPAWHPAPLSFRAMVLSFVFMEITGDSYAEFSRRLTRQPELVTILGFSRVPDESAFSRAWRNRFDDAVQEYVHAAAHFVSKEVHDRDISTPEVRPKPEIVDDEQEDADSVKKRTSEFARSYPGQEPFAEVGFGEQPKTSDDLHGGEMHNDHEGPVEISLTVNKKLRERALVLEGEGMISDDEYLVIAISTPARYINKVEARGDGPFRDGRETAAYRWSPGFVWYMCTNSSLW